MDERFLLALLARRGGEALMLMRDMSLGDRPGPRVPPEWIGVLRAVAEDQSKTDECRGRAKELLSGRLAEG